MHLNHEGVRSPAYVRRGAFPAWFVDLWLFNDSYIEFESVAGAASYMVWGYEEDESVMADEKANRRFFVKPSIVGPWTLNVRPPAGETWVVSMFATGNGTTNCHADLMKGENPDTTFSSGYGTNSMKGGFLINNANWFRLRYEGTSTAMGGWAIAQKLPF